jgi:hypothetical protein
MSSWTFIIQNYCNELRFIPIIIESIKKQNIPKYEILFAENDFVKEDNIIKIIYSNNKNEIAKHAQYDNLCFLTDYMILNDNWYEGFEELGYDWDISSTKIINVYRSEINLNYCFKRIFFLENIKDDVKHKNYKKNKKSFVNCLI